MRRIAVYLLGSLGTWHCTYLRTYALGLRLHVQVW